MKKLCVTLAVVLLCFTPVMAETPYLSGSFGVGFPNSVEEKADGTLVDTAKLKTGFPFTGAIGISFGTDRVEFSIGSQSYDVDTITFYPAASPYTTQGKYSGNGLSESVMSYMVNAYHDFKMKALSPYIMAGIGFANERTKYLSAEEFNHTSIMYQVGCGVGVKASDKVTIDAGYKYSAIPATTNYLPGIKIDSSTSGHQILIGFRREI
ncbi:MAG: outer membrane beta-barrel protein [Chlorobiaceae bacterium]